MRPQRRGGHTGGETDRTDRREEAKPVPHFHLFNRRTKSCGARLTPAPVRYPLAQGEATGADGRLARGRVASLA